MTICGFGLELGEGEGWTSPPLSFATKLIDPSANYTKTFRQKSAENIANNLDVNGTKLIDSGANCDTLGPTMICCPAYYICLYQTNQA